MVTRPFTKETLVSFQQGINPSAMMVEKSLSKASTANFSAPSPMVVLSGIVLSQGDWEFFEIWGSGMGEKLRSEVRTASMFQPNPMVACKSIGTMRPPAAGKEFTVETGLVHPGRCKRLSSFEVRSRKIPERAGRRHGSGETGITPPGGWEDIQFCLRKIRAKGAARAPESIEMLENASVNRLR
ncbi:MAG: hypothetical protein CM15mP48_2970 [Candidatus Poseidoniales archaeon]|nr:MAG: hypothetical protein CM15mP48_2970 [Candidatus Poseidoniales archaeon]